jgi:hypothetical protein
MRNCDQFVLFNEGQFHMIRGGRLLSFGSSSGGAYYYFTVYEEIEPDGDALNTSWGEPQQTSLDRQAAGEKVWPTESEKAAGVWVAAVQGYEVLVCKTPDGERHTEI